MQTVKDQLTLAQSLLQHLCPSDSSHRGCFLLWNCPIQPAPTLIHVSMLPLVLHLSVLWACARGAEQACHYRFQMQMMQARPSSLVEGTVPVVSHRACSLQPT